MSLCDAPQAARRPPGCRTVARVELFDAGFLFDDLGPVEPEAPNRAHDDLRAERSRDAHSAVTPDAPRNDGHDRGALAQRDDGVADLGDR